MAWPRSERLAQWAGMSWRSRGVVALWCAVYAVVFWLALDHLPLWGAMPVLMVAGAAVGIAWSSQRPPRVLPAGEWGVQLLDAGSQPMQAVVEIARMEISFADARAATQSTPVVVLRGVSRETADELVTALQKHGAAAEVVGAEA